MADSPGNKMKVVEHGELEDITKPESKRNNGGCRISSADRTSDPCRMPTIQTTSLELLQPDDVTEQDYAPEEDDDVSAVGSYTDLYADTGRTSSIFRITEPRAYGRSSRQSMPVEGRSVADSADNEFRLTRQFSNEDSLDADDDDSADEAESDEEEREILREIRAEITLNVRTEMKSELAVFEQKKAAALASAEKLGGEQMEAKMREAFAKMHKLDRILTRKISQEKRVKRQRIRVQKELCDELDRMKKDGTSERRDESINTMKFLALTLPPKHNEGVEEDPAVSVTPVFHQTQLPGHEVKRSSVVGSVHGGSTEELEDGSSVGATSRVTSGTKGADKDFIKRNIQLAADASNTIAMTDDEKQRLAELLADIDNIPDETEIDSENPYQIVLSDGEGFLPTSEQMQKLDAIDVRLKAILPAADYDSVASTGRCSTVDQQSVLFTRTHLETEMEPEEEPGDRALRQAKQKRDLQKRLDDIEQQLQQLTSVMEHEVQSPTLSGAQLDDLLDMCARTMSRATDETASIEQMSDRQSRASLLQNARPLPSDVLQQLLSEARQTNNSRSHTIDDQASFSDISEVDQISRPPSSRLSSRVESPTTLHSRPQSRRSTAQSPSLAQSPTRRPFLPNLDPRGTPLSSQSFCASSVDSRPVESFCDTPSARSCYMATPPC